VSGSYDRVEMPPANGVGLPRQLSRSEFESLPLDQRVRAILGKKLKFFRGKQEITIREALGD
jgi:hypothetical protein